MPTKSNDIPGKAELRKLFRKLCLEKKECRTDNVAVYRYLKDLQKAAGVGFFRVALASRIVGGLIYGQLFCPLPSVKTVSRS